MMVTMADDHTLGGGGAHRHRQTKARDRGDTSLSQHNTQRETMLPPPLLAAHLAVHGDDKLDAPNMTPTECRYRAPRP